MNMQWISEADALGVAFSEGELTPLTHTGAIAPFSKIYVAIISSCFTTGSYT